jgi:hypothetical protein
MDNIFEEIIDTVEQLFTICVDDNGYYTTENTDNLVQVKSMPNITDVKQLLAYRYNEEIKELEADETKLAEINYEIENPPVTLTAEERLADLENAFLELSTMILGGM